jgi:predicted CXXCH cytochrome family protein
MDLVINAPGPGNYVATGGPISGGTMGAMTGAPVPMLETDLRDDHPISIDYAGGACRGFTTGACDPQSQATGDPDFQPVQYALINNTNQWWVDVGVAGATAGQRDKTDMILYTRTISGTEGPSVECGSCHDPHEDTARPVSFLRISNDDSAVCLACHIK